jgi:hypothetical protein
MIRSHPEFATGAGVDSQETIQVGWRISRSADFFCGHADCCAHVMSASVGNCQLESAVLRAGIS